MWYVAFIKANSPKSVDEEAIGDWPLKLFQVIVSKEAETFFGMFISRSTCPSTLINRSLSPNCTLIYREISS